MSGMGRGHIFFIALLKFPDWVFTVTTRTMPSASGCRVVTLPSGHRRGGTWSSIRRTSELSSMFLPRVVHLLLFCNSDKYSRCQRCHSNWRVFCKCYQWGNRLSGVLRKSYCPGWFCESPMRKWEGVRTLKSNGSLVTGVKGRELRTASIQVTRVLYSSYVSAFSWVTV